MKQETACNTRVLADGKGESKPQVGSRNLTGCRGACGLRTLSRETKNLKLKKATKALHYCNKTRDGLQHEGAYRREGGIKATGRFEKLNRVLGSLRVTHAYKNKNEPFCTARLVYI